jgi:hypothetical protein
VPEPRTGHGRRAVNDRLAVNHAFDVLCSFDDTWIAIGPIVGTAREQEHAQLRTAIILMRPPVWYGADRTCEVTDRRANPLSHCVGRYSQHQHEFERRHFRFSAYDGNP